MPRLRVLFVCGRNLRRSPTAEKIFQNDQRLSVRSAGVSDSSKRKIQWGDLIWADLILVMEPKYADRIRSKYAVLGSLPAMSSLDIPDEFEFMDQDLIDLLIPAVEEAIQEYQGQVGSQR